MQKYKLFGDPDFLKGLGEEGGIAEAGVFVDRNNKPYDGKLPRKKYPDSAIVTVGVDLALAITARIVRDFPVAYKKVQQERAAPIDPPAPKGFVSPASIDVPIAPAMLVGGQHWHLGGGDHSFGTATDALVSMGLPAKASPTSGEGIGVVIVDHGLNRDYVNALTQRQTYGGGWHLTNTPGLAFPGQTQQPYTRLSDMHGNMIARNILRIAPGVTVYDAPLLPERITDLEAFSSAGTALMRSIAQVIDLSELIPFFPQHKHWIIVNAWAAATTMADLSGILSYAGNPAHRLNQAVSDLAGMENVEVVFAAGNAGAFQPAAFTGPYDRGHQRSIWGCNGLPEVHTIGAVRTDGIAIGASSQGPSQTTLTSGGTVNQKPDFVTPSWFREDTDASVTNTGTSASSALFAGVLAHIISTGAPMTSDAVGTTLDAMSGLPGDWHPQRGRGHVKVG